MNKLKAHLNNIVIFHSIFALPFAYMGLFLAYDGKVPTFHDFFYITLAMIGARSSAMAMDNLVDLKFDKLQGRMKNRPLVTGALKPFEVIVMILLCLSLFIFATLHLNPICIYLAPICIFFLLFYPYTKRISYLCHYFLGLTLAMAPAGAYIAVRGELPLSIMFLSLGVCLWIGSFDIIYGSQDREFDLKNNLHSMATKFGIKKAHLISRIIHCISIFSFVIAGILLNLSFSYYIGVIIAGITLIYQHSLIKENDFSMLTQKYFMRNGIVAIAIFLFTLIALFCKL